MIMRRREFLTLIGAAAAWPLAARAQQTVPVVGFLHPALPAGYAPFIEAFRRGLEEAGFVDGRNVTIEFRWGEDHADRLPALAADLVRRRVAVIVGNGGAALAAKDATSTIPIVFSTGSDPIEMGLVASFNRPGGNVTGTVQFNDELVGKRLEMMRELVPGTAVIGLLLDPTSPSAPMRSKAFQGAAARVGQSARILNTESQTQFEAAFAAAARDKVGALVVPNSTLFTNNRELLVTLAARYAIPASYEYREFVTAGGLLSYGSSNADSYRQVGTYAGRILKGEKPADLPVVQPTRFELVINRKTAKTLGLTVPPTLLVAADEVIE